MRATSVLSRVAQVGLVAGVLVLALEIRDVAGALGLKLRGPPFPFGGAVLDNALAVLLAAVVAALLAARRGIRFRDLGVVWPGWAGPALTLLATAPCWFGLALQGKLASDLTPLSLVLLTLVFPLAEEFVFRGFGFVFTRRRLGWPWAPAAALQALAFGLVHWLGAGGASGGGMAWQILAITTLGGLVFAGLDALDGDAIWSGWVFHASLNAAWTVFAVSPTAATGWVGNTLRVVSAALALALLYALRQARRRRGRVTLHRSSGPSLTARPPGP